MRGIAILSSLLFLFGCNSGAPQDGGNGGGASGDAIRITHVWFNIDPKTREVTPIYRVMLSNSWREKFGSWQDTSGSTTKEPFRRIIPNPFLNEHVPDKHMVELFELFMEKGFDNLPHRDAASIPLTLLKEMPKETNPRRIRMTRILSIARGDYVKTVLYTDILDASLTQPKSRELNLAFAYPEWQLMRKDRYYNSSVQVTHGTAPFDPKRRDHD